MTAPVDALRQLVEDMHFNAGQERASAESLLNQQDGKAADYRARAGAWDAAERIARSALAAAESPAPASDPLTVECVTCGHEALSHMDGTTGEIVECWHMQGGRNRCTCRKFVPDRLSQIPTLDLDAIDDEARWLIDTSAVPSTIVFARRTRTLLTELRRLRSQSAPASVPAEGRRCPTCDRGDCPRIPIARRWDAGERLTVDEMYAKATAEGDCQAHAADWPARAQDWERLLEAVRALIEAAEEAASAMEEHDAGADAERFYDLRAQLWSRMRLVRAALSPTDGRNKL